MEVVYNFQNCGALLENFEIMGDCWRLSKILNPLFGFLLFGKLFHIDAFFYEDRVLKIPCKIIL